MDFDFRKIGQDRLPGLENFFKQVYRGKIPYGEAHFFDWKIFKNIHRTGIINAAFAGEEIASTTTLVPKTLYYKGQELKVAEIGDTYTGEKFQRKGLFATLINKTRSEGEEAGIQFIYGTPNQESLPGYVKKANFAVSEMLAVHSYAVPLSLREKIKIKVFSVFLDFFFKLIFDLLVKLKSLFVNSSLTLAEEKLPTDIDQLWNQAKQDFEFIMKRDRQSLEWRFENNPYDYKYFILRKSGQITAYYIIREVGRVAILADYLSTKKSSKEFAQGLNLLIDHYRKNNFEKISTWVSMLNPLESQFRQSFFLKTSKIPIIVYNNQFYQQTESVKVAQFTLSDSDNI